MAIVTFKFCGPQGFVPSLTVCRADTLAVVGSGTAVETSALGFYQAAIDVGAYSDDVLVSVLHPTGCFYGHIADGICQLRSEPPASGSGGGSITVLPLNGAVQDRVDGTTINLFYGEVLSVAIAITNAAGEPVSLAGKTLEVVIEGRTRVDQVAIPDGQITKASNTVSFTPPIGVTSKIGRRKWCLRDVTSGSGEGAVLAHGSLNVNYLPASDA